MKLGLLGGTFDPVHIAHLILAEAAREQLGLDRVLFVPAGRPWRKAGRTIAPVEHRVAMLRLAIEGNDAFEVSTLEAERSGPSYTAETLRQLHAAHGEVQVFFLMGEDALLDLPNWREPDVIRRLSTLVVAGRSDGPAAHAASEAATPLAMPRIDISSTAIRDRVRLGLSVRYWVPDAVERYIREQGLYR